MLTLVWRQYCEDAGKVADMGAIPPGPQIPFSKDRSYGQEPGLISRNMGKVAVVLVVLAVLATVAFVAANSSRGGGDHGQGSIPTPTRP